LSPGQPLVLPDKLQLRHKTKNEPETYQARQKCTHSKDHYVIVFGGPAIITL
jgi:hypothetical protein